VEYLATTSLMTFTTRSDEEEETKTEHLSHLVSFAATGILVFCWLGGMAVPVTLVALLHWRGAPLAWSFFISTCFKGSCERVTWMALVAALVFRTLMQDMDIMIIIYLASLLVYSNSCLVAWPHSETVQRFLQNMGAYFPAELGGEYESVLPERSLLSVHPHGMLAAGYASTIGFNSHFSPRPVLLINRILREHNALFKLLTDLDGGFATLDGTTLGKLLQSGKNVAVLPGGLEEAAVSQFGRERVVLKGKTGFIKRALQAGSRVHPVYVFGENRTYVTFSLPAGRISSWLNRVGMPTVVGYGRFPWVFMPFRTPLRAFVGAPLVLPHLPEPTEKEVAHWCEEYKNALVKVFDDNKEEAGLDAKTTLEIL